jgi:molybdopterin molybdotransferase
VPENVVSLEAALRIVQQHASALARPAETETVALCTGPHARILAETIHATRDQPAFHRSTRDGFAVNSAGFALRSADLAHHPPLRVLGLLRAGEHWNGPPLAENEAIEIMTGAPLPPGADCVLMLEHAEHTGDTLRSNRNLSPGENVVPRAAEARAGDTLLYPGQPLDPAAIALAAGCGRKELTVFARPRVGILATGDELVEPGDAPPAAAPLEDWQIYNSNTYAVASLVTAQGANPACLPIAPDRREGSADSAGLDLRIAAAAQFDLALFSGGVSMGKYDLVEPALTAQGAEFFFTGVRIQPGKPVVFGRLPKNSHWPRRPENDSGYTYFFGLPGNPVSTEVCFHLFVAPFLRALAGLAHLAPQFVAAVAAEPFAGKPGLTRLLPARLESTFREATIRPVPWQGSGDTAANARANCYCVVPPEGLAAAEMAQVLLR